MLTTRLMRDLLDKVNNPSSLVHAAAAPFHNRAGDDGEGEDEMVRMIVLNSVLSCVIDI